MPTPLDFPKDSNELNYCKNCIQMTNHIQDTCLKCGLASPKDSNVPEWEEEVRLLAEEHSVESLIHYIRTLIASETAKRDEQIKDRINNVFASKYEGVERINIKHEYAVMSCFDDRNY